MGGKGSGGKRQGAGPKAALHDASKKTIALEARHVGILEKFRQSHGLPTLSAAVRHLIEQSNPNKN